MDWGRQSLFRFNENRVVNKSLRPGGRHHPCRYVSGLTLRRGLTERRADMGSSRCRSKALEPGTRRMCFTLCRSSRREGRCLVNLFVAAPTCRTESNGRAKTEKYPIVCKNRSFYMYLMITAWSGHARKPVERRGLLTSGGDYSSPLLGRSVRTTQTIAALHLIAATRTGRRRHWSYRSLPGCPPRETRSGRRRSPGRTIR